MVDFASSQFSIQQNAVFLFTIIESFPSDEIEVDFQNLTDITPVFVRDYLIKKAESSKLISEINMSPEVTELFATIESTMRKSPMQ